MLEKLAPLSRRKPMQVQDAASGSISETAPHTKWFLGLFCFCWIAISTGLYPPNNAAEPNLSQPLFWIFKRPIAPQRPGDEFVSFVNAGQKEGTSDVGNVPPLSDSEFVNPIGEGADPWVVRDGANDRYLWCFSNGNRAIGIHTSTSLSDLGTRHIVWRAPETGPYRDEIWAPELHRIGEKWYIYFAASDGNNENHLAYVLESKTEDALGEYTLHGPLATGDGGDGRTPNVWAIDMTPLQHNGKLYAIWSGWDKPKSDHQYLYIAPMQSPTELSGPRVRIANNDDFPWEFTEDDGKGRGLNEGPQILKHNGRVFVVYSCGGSWLPTYKLGMFELTGGNPLEPSSWTKSQRPAFESTAETFGVGHSCFVPSRDGSEMWHVYHAKQEREPGWRRGIFVQPMSFDETSGRPRFGRPVAPGTPIKKPSGESASELLPLPLSLDRTPPEAT